MRISAVVDSSMMPRIENNPKWRATARAYQSNEISLDLELPMVWLWVLASLGLTFSVFVCLLMAFQRSGAEDRSLSDG